MPQVAGFITPLRETSLPCCNLLLFAFLELLFRARY